MASLLDCEGCALVSFFHRNVLNSLEKRGLLSLEQLYIFSLPVVPKNAVCLWNILTSVHAPML